MVVTKALFTLLSSRCIHNAGNCKQNGQVCNREACPLLASISRKKGNTVQVDREIAKVFFTVKAWNDWGKDWEYISPSYRDMNTAENVAKVAAGKEGEAHITLTYRTPGTRYRS